MAKAPEPVKERIRKLSRVDENGCWQWIANLSGDRRDGGKHTQPYITIAKCYPPRSPKQRNRAACRVSYEVYKGAIPFGLRVIHTCSNAQCVNPDHLVLGDSQEQSRLMQLRGAIAFGSGRPHKIMEADALRIRSLVNMGVSKTATARAFDISESMVRYIVAGKKWRNIGDLS